MATLTRTVRTLSSLSAVTSCFLLVTLRQEMHYNSAWKLVMLNNYYASIQSCLSMITSVNELTIMMSLFNCSDVNSYLPDFVLVNSSLCFNSSKLREFCKLKNCSICCF